MGSIKSPIHLRSLQRLKNRLEHDRRVCEHVFVPEAQDTKPTGPQKGISSRVVVGLFGVLAPIQLNDDGGLKTGEVANVRSHRMLTTKLEVSQLAPTQVSSQQSLRIGRVFAEGASKAKHPSWCPIMRASMWRNTTYESIRLMTPPSPYDGDTSQAKLGRKA